MAFPEEALVLLGELVRVVQRVPARGTDDVRWISHGDLDAWEPAHIHVVCGLQQSTANDDTCNLADHVALQHHV